MYRKVYFVGIKGVGMATLAIIAKQAGFIVGGSDVDEEFITDKILQDAKIDICKGFREDNVHDFFGTTPKWECLMIATGAHGGFDNVEVKAVRGDGHTKIISHGEAVGLFMSGELFDRADIEGISVTGAHGKTTTSSMIATFLMLLGFDPSYSIGTSEIVPIGAAGHFGKGRFFVAEADEYMAGAHDKTPKFLYQSPKFLIINNIDFDHPDFYRDIEDVAASFSRLTSNLKSDSVLIANGDDENVKKIIKDQGNRIRVITFGTGTDNEFRLANFRQNEWNSEFSVFRGVTKLADFKLSVPGYHNAKNATAAIAFLVEAGVSVPNIQKVLPQFKGASRRLEQVGLTASGAVVFDDYAHHPEEIRKTLEAIRAAYPEKKITVIFQAHTYERTRSMLSEFAASFAGVSELIILPTFASARHDASTNLSEDMQFVEKVRAIQANVKLIESKRDVVKYLDQNRLGSDSIILTMGAGDVYKIGHELISFAS
ncbi:MAG TPA: UDP-N-acetylmuramate--L-alanine ligase [Patescibacteria group bacterium]|nr:UDP-N-acetylmuramate--L-alanine ligase [Patescibacteria group bacterium]